MKKSLLVLATLLSCLNSFAQDDPKSKAIVDKLVAKSKADRKSVV